MEHPWSTALVTGASSGIGEAIAVQLGAAGVDVVLVARRADRLEQLAARCAASGAAVEVLPADLADADGRTAVAARLGDPDRPVDLLVNCAGLGAATGFVDGDRSRYDQILAVNVTAVVELSRAAMIGMHQRRRGWVLNVSSLGGFRPPVPASRCTGERPKAFVTSFSESIHEEYRRSGIVVTAVCPGATRTEFNDTSGTMGDDLPEFMWQEPDEVAREGLDALRAGRAVRVTGLPNRLTAGLSAMAPRGVRRRVAGMVTDRL